MAEAAAHVLQADSDGEPSESEGTGQPQEAPQGHSDAVAEHPCTLCGQAPSAAAALAPSTPGDNIFSQGRAVRYL